MGKHILFDEYASLEEADEAFRKSDQRDYRRPSKYLYKICIPMGTRVNFRCGFSSSQEKIDAIKAYLSWKCDDLVSTTNPMFRGQFIEGTLTHNFIGCVGAYYSAIPLYKYDPSKICVTVPMILSYYYSDDTEIYVPANKCLGWDIDKANEHTNDVNSGKYDPTSDECLVMISCFGLSPSRIEADPKLKSAIEAAKYRIRNKIPSPEAYDV